MARPLRTAALAALLAACSNSSGPAFVPKLLVRPVLDSVFVGDSLAARTVVFVSAPGDTVTPGPVRWVSGTPGVFAVDSASGAIAGTGRGTALLLAIAGKDTGQALIAVSDTLDLTLLLDTIYLLPGDTFTIPADVRRRGGSPPAARFATNASSAIFTLDSTGFVTALQSAAPQRFTAQAGAIVDSGTIEVRPSTDTASRAYFTTFGTANRRDNGKAQAFNYHDKLDSLTFQLYAYTLSGSNVLDDALITAMRGVGDTTSFVLDSLSPQEALASADPVCLPPRNWATWATRALGRTVTGVSRPGGRLVITTFTHLPNNAVLLGGRFTYPAQRTDLYGDPDGLVTVRGTFVAPLQVSGTACR